MSATKKQLKGKKIQASVTHNSVIEQRLNICLSAGNLAWWEMDCKTGKVIFNENKVKMLGYDMHDFNNVDYTAFTNLLHPDDFEPTMQAMRDLLEGKTKLYDVEYRIKTKKGQYRWFYDRGSIVERTPQGQPLVVKGVVFDITERKQAEEQLAENLANLEQIYKNPFIIYEWKVKPLVTTILSTLIKNMIDSKHPKEYLQAFYQEKMIYDMEQKNNKYSPLNNDIFI